MVLIPTHADTFSEPSSPPSREGLGRVFGVLETVLLVAVVICGLFTVARTFIRIQSPFQMDYAEGTILNTSLRLAQDGSLYQPVRRLPYEIDPYPPFIYWIVSLVVAHTKLSFFYPRLIVLGAAILACLLAVLLIHQWTRQWRLAVIFGLLPLTVAPVQAWLGILRYDFIGIALVMAGLVVFVLLPKFRFWSIPFFVVAVGGLYTLVAAPAACCLHLLMQREKKKALLFGACFLGALVVGFLYGQHVSGGYMGYHLFKTQHSPYSISQLASFGQGMLRGYALLLLLSAVTVWKGAREKGISLVGLYWILAVGTALSLGKIGASQNHLLQLVFAVCISAAVAYDWIRRNATADFGLVLVLSTMILTSMANTPLRIDKPIDDLSGCKQAYAAVRVDLGDRILADNVGALVFASKPAYVSDPFVFRWLVTNGGFSDADLRQRITSRDFTSIVLDTELDAKETNGGRWPDDIRQAIREHYRLKEEFVCNDARFVYEPKDASLPKQPESPTMAGQSLNLNHSTDRGSLP
jgi:hypothetical protein